MPLRKLARGRVLLSSFQPEAVAGAQTTAPELPRCLLLDTQRDSWAEEAKALACSAVITNYALLDQTRVAAIHAMGMKAER